MYGSGDVMALPTLQHEGGESGGGLPVDEDSVLLDVLAELETVEVPGREEQLASHSGLGDTAVLHARIQDGRGSLMTSTVEPL